MTAAIQKARDAVVRAAGLWHAVRVIRGAVALRKEDAELHHAVRRWLRAVDRAEAAAKKARRRPSDGRRR